MRTLLVCALAATLVSGCATYDYGFGGTGAYGYDAYAPGNYGYGQGPANAYYPPFGYYYGYGPQVYYGSIVVPGERHVHQHARGEEHGNGHAEHGHGQGDHGHERSGSRSQFAPSGHGGSERFHPAENNVGAAGGG